MKRKMRWRENVYLFLMLWAALMALKEMGSLEGVDWLLLIMMPIWLPASAAVACLALFISSGLLWGAYLAIKKGSGY